MRERLDKNIKVIEAMNGAMCATIESNIDDGNYHLYTFLSYTVYNLDIAIHLVSEVTRHGHIVHRCQKTYSYYNHASANQMYQWLLEDTGFNNLED